jgi:hypothetical protein
MALAPLGMPGILPRVKLLAPAVLVLVAVAACGANAKPHRGPARVLGCGAAILRVHSGTAGGRRVILGGAVSVPAAYLPQAVANDDRGWTFWEKAVLVVRDGRGPVEVSVPERARSRVAIGWGNPAYPGSRQRIAACPGRRWKVYTGGFFIRARRVCVPVTLRAGGHATTVTFGLGRRCPQP